MDAESHAFYTINMNSFSDAPSLQIILEQPLEKKSGARARPHACVHMSVQHPASPGRTEGCYS